jgi:hypothetical protein
MPPPFLRGSSFINFFRDTLTLRTNQDSKSRSCITTQTAQVRAPNALARRLPSISTQPCTGCPVMTVIPLQTSRPLYSLTIIFKQTAAPWAASWSSTWPDCTLFQQQNTSSSPLPSFRAFRSTTRYSRPKRRYARRTFRQRRYSSRCVRRESRRGEWTTLTNCTCVPAYAQSVTVDGIPWKSNCFIEWDVFVRGATVELELTADPNVPCGVLPPSLSTGGFS